MTDAYSKHGEEGGLELFVYGGRRFPAKEAQGDEVDAVPQRRPSRLIKRNLDRHSPPILEREQRLMQESRCIRVSLHNKIRKNYTSQAKNQNGYLTEMVVVVRKGSVEGEPYEARPKHTSPVKLEDGLPFVTL
jgi:hypothetical protein